MSSLVLNLKAKNIGGLLLGQVALGPSKCTFLPLEEGGRYATLRLQFIQKFLTGSVDVVWREVAKSILHRVDGLGLDTALFLTDTKKLHFSGLPSFYLGLLKV